MTDHGLPGPQRSGAVAQRQPDHRHLRRHLGQRQRVGQPQRHPRGRRAQGQPGRLHEVRLQTATLQRTRTPAALRNYGRLRSVTRTANGDLLITTANGSDDAVLRVHPRG